MKKFSFLRRMIPISMRRCKIFLLLILFVIALTLAADPVISFNFLSHNFGDIKEEDGKVSYDFTFTNTGDDTLKIIKVKAS